MSKLKPVVELLKAVGQALGNVFRGPMPQPRPAPPAPRPAPPRPQPQPPRPAPPVNPRPAPPAPRPAPPRPQPQPPRPEPSAPKPRRPIPPTGTETEPQPEPEPQAEPDPETDGPTETGKAPKTEDDQRCKTCPKCIPRQMGTSVPHIFGDVPPASKRGYDYQHFVCPWHYYVPESNMIEEWNFMGVDFDGLHPLECHLYEAKHGYDGFLQQDDWSAEGRPKLQDWVERSQKAKVFENMADQARRQVSVVAPLYPDVRLTWVFSSMMTKLYVFEIFLDNGLVPPIDAEVRPFV